MSKPQLTPVRHFQLKIPVGTARLDADLVIPEKPVGAVIFAHGSGSNRLSPRNLLVAKTLQQTGLATLLFDLVPPERSAKEEKFDVQLLAGRLITATYWLEAKHTEGKLPIGYFGASTGAAAALAAAVDVGRDVRAVVSRGGRPDLAGERLAEVEAATLLIVGGEDHQVLEYNRNAYEKLHCNKDLEVIPGATHLFEEPLALEAVAHLTADWFLSSFGAMEEVAPEPLRSSGSFAIPARSARLG